MLLVDDHQFTRVTLGSALSARGLDVHAVATAREALELADSLPNLGVALLDLDLGKGPTGLDLSVELRSRSPRLGIILLTSYRDPRLAAMNLPHLPQGGVFLCKDEISDISLLAATIELVRQQPLTRRSRTLGTSNDLTDTQIEVLHALASGATTAQIARDRGVSEGAVEKTIARICERLDIPRDPGINQRVQLVHAYNQLRGLP